MRSAQRPGRRCKPEKSRFPSSHHPESRKNLQTVIAVSGPVDYVTDGEREAYVENGTPLLTRVTGTGCMLTAVIGCCLGAGIEPFTPQSSP